MAGSLPDWLIVTTWPVAQANLVSPWRTLVAVKSTSIDGVPDAVPLFQTLARDILPRSGSPLPYSPMRNGDVESISALSTTVSVSCET